MTLQTSGQISISQINTEVADVNSNSLATLAANSHEYKTALDNLQNAPHAMSEWYGYDDDILWEHEIVVGHSTYGAKTTFHRYGLDSDDFDYTLGCSVDMGTSCLFHVPFEASVSWGDGLAFPRSLKPPHQTQNKNRLRSK